MADRVRRWLAAWAVVAGMAGGFGPARAGEGPTLKLTVDIRDLPRHLVHSRIEIPCHPGKLALWYPKWIPGTHSPCGPVQNVAGLRIETKDGRPIAWRRDETDVYRVECDVPTGVELIVVKLDVICGKPAVEAAGYLTYGNRSLAIVNWATCLMYPEGPPADELRVEAKLEHLPDTWEFACALQDRSETQRMGRGMMGGFVGPGYKTIAFRPVSLNELVDNPVIAGEHMRSIPLDSGLHPPAYLDIASQSAAGLQVSPEVVAIYSRVVREAGALFGTCHYPSFHFLVTCSDDLGYLGLEHLACSINGVREHDLVNRGSLRGWVGNLLPHEYVHSWCGKFRRPAGMCTPDYQTPQKTRLLWVYEGLAEYLGELLMVRSGMIDQAEYRRMLTASIDGLVHRDGRKWRSLEDTAVASHLLRGGGPYWTDLRRGQDYYFEGALIWLEVDAIIREKTQGKKGLDDFCRKFLGMGPTEARVVPYELADVVGALRELCDFDWERFLRDRTEKPLESLPLDVVGRCGYRLDYTADPPPAASRISRAGGGGVAARDSIGLSFDGEGKVSEVVPGKVGDKAGIGPGTKVMGVNGKVFSRQAVLDALAESTRSRKVTLLIAEGENLRTIELNYADGPRYLTMVRDGSKPDLLAAILRPIAPAPPPGVVALAARPRGYVCRRTMQQMRIDGRLDEAAWNNATWTDDFVDIEGDARPKPQFRTRAKMLWDDNYLYIGALLDEPDVWGTLTKHDSVIFHDNDFEVFIDPNGDNHEYYEIEINALNTEWDLFLEKPYRDGGPARNEWEIPGLKTGVHVQGTLNNPADRDTSWSVEVAIPWKALAQYAHRPAPPRAGDQWRMNFSRVEWRHEVKDGQYCKVPGTREDNWVWSPQGAIDMHRPERWGYVQFSADHTGWPVVEPDPAGHIRDRLMQIYHAQAAFRKKNDRWAGNLAELGLSDLARQPTRTIELRTTPDGYVATATFASAAGEQTWEIRQDSRIRRVEGVSGKLEERAR